MQVAFYIIPTARKYKQLTSNQLNMNIEKIYKVCERAERASVEIFAFVRSKTPISFNVWVGYLRILSACLSVTLLHECTLRIIICSFNTNANDMAL